MGYFEKQAFTRDQAEKYGIDLKYETVNGRHEDVDWEASNAAVAKAMANDYDTRRTIEAAQMSGNKKANKLGQGISNISEAVNAERFMAKTHKNRMGNTGKYTNANDEGGVTDYWINKERGKQNAQFATKEDLSALQQQQAEAVKQTPSEEPYQPSEELVQARERVQAWEQDDQNSDSPYGVRKSSSSDAYGSALKQAQQGGSVETDVDSFTQKLADRKNNQEGAQNFADDFRKDVKIGANFKPVL